MNQKLIIKLFHLFLPYFLIIAGFVLVVIMPVSFYKNTNLNLNVNTAYLSTGVQTPATIIQSAGDQQIAKLPVSRPITPIFLDKSKFDEALTAKAILAVDQKSGSILFSDDKNKVRSLASITKLMSAIILLDYSLDWNSTTTIIEADGNGDQHVKYGEIFSLKDLWNAALVGSSNKATNALVRATGQSQASFVERMNQRAQELKLYSLKFTEPTGLSAGNVGSAHDVTMLLEQALRYEKIYQTLMLEESNVKPLDSGKIRLIWSTNWLLSGWIASDLDTDNMAGKTGYIDESGFNFVCQINNPKNNRKIIVAILGAATNDHRFVEARDITDWIFANYIWPEDEEYGKIVE